jgi:hypothetical protein
MLSSQRFRPKTKKDQRIAFKVAAGLFELTSSGATDLDRLLAGSLVAWPLRAFVAAA